MSAYLSIEEIAHSQKQLRRKKLKLFAFTLPLLCFVTLAFLAPIATMLYRSVYNPTVSQLIPNTLTEMEAWKTVPGKMPPAEVLTAFSLELRTLSEERRSGKLAEEINRVIPGTSSLVKSSARKIKRISVEELATGKGEQLLSLHKKWNNPDLWSGIKAQGSVWTDRYYLTATDLERNQQGEIESRDTQIYLKLYWRSLRIALMITLLTALLAFPLSYYLANCSDKKANTLIVFVLLPFWTSLLVRTTSWIALLQTNGVINSTLQFLGITNEPIEMLYTEFATIISMTHILLPFMVLPLYSVMKNIDPSYFRAALTKTK